MKTLKFSALVALFIVGTIATLRAFGEPVEPISDNQWLTQFCLSASVSIPSWLTFAYLAKRWGGTSK